MKIPSSPHKRYLSGADWCVAALERGTIETTGRPTVFHVAVFLDGLPDEERMEARFREYCGRFPLLWGRPARCWCLAPYWKSPASAFGQIISVGHIALPGAVTMDDVVRQIESLANERARLRSCAVALQILTWGEARSVLVFSFDHLLFDAAGAERFLDLFFRFLDGRTTEGDFPDPNPTEPAQLDQWLKRFASGRKLNRAMRDLSPGASAGLDLPADVARRPFRFRVASLTEEESRRVQAQAFSTAGYLMFMPYVLATAAAVFRPHFVGRAEPDSNFTVTVSTSRLRPPTGGAPHFFFNDLSFLYFGFPMSAATDRDALARTVRDQMIAQVKDEMPAAIEDSNLLMRILPARLFWKFMVLFFRNRLSSFALTCLGDPLLKASSALGCPIRCHVHFPVIPTPPGLGLVLSRSGKVYHAILSYIEGILPEEDVDALLDSFRKLLLGDSTDRK